MKIALLSFLASAALLVGIQPARSQSAFTESIVPDTQSMVLPQEYWFAPIQNDTDLTGKFLELTIGALSNTVAYVQFGTEKVLTLQITANRDRILSMPLTEEMKSSGIVEKKAVHVWTYGSGILCQFLSSVARSSDAMRILPTEASDTQFVVAGYGTPYGLGDQPSEFSIAASTDSTVLEIIPSCDLRNSKTFGLDSQEAYPANVPIHLVLNRGQSVQFQSALGYGEGLLDVSGTIIHSSHPVAVVGGSMRAQIPDPSQPPGSYVCDMIPPVSAWGSTYYTRSSSGYAIDLLPDEFLLIASKPHQRFFWNSCYQPTTQVETQSDSLYGVTWAEINAPSKIWSDAPFLLAEYTNGDHNGYSNGTYPSEVVLTPESGFRKTVLFEGPPNTQADITFNKNDLGNVLLDGSAIRSSNACISDTFESYNVADLSLPVHLVQSDSGADVLLTAMNDSSVDAWSGYPVGSASSDTIPPAAVFEENAACIRATVTDFGSGISSFYLDSSTNMSLSVDNTFIPGSGVQSTYADLCVNDISKPGSIRFKAFDKAANFSTIRITFDPSLLPSHPGFTVQSLNFDTVLTHTSKTLPLLTVTDTSPEFPVVLSRIWTNDPGFLFDRGLASNALPDTLTPGQSHTFSLTFQPTSDGTYTGTFNVASGELPVRTVNVTGIGYSLVADVLASNGEACAFELTPNPASRRVLLRYAIAPSATANIGIYSVLGSELLHWASQSGGTGEHTIDLSALPAGVYIYRFQTSDGQTRSGKLIVEP